MEKTPLRLSLLSRLTLMLCILGIIIIAGCTAPQQGAAAPTATSPSPAASVTTISAPVTNGLVAYWNFDENSGNAVHDASGNQINGVLQGASWAPGKFGSALNFNGNDNSVGFPDSSSFDSVYTTNQFTVAAWINQKDRQWNDWTKHQFIFMKGSSDTAPGMFELFYVAQADKPEYGFTAHFDSTDQPYGTGLWVDATNYPCGQWVHLSGVYDGQTMYLYIDGVLADSQTIGKKIQSNNGPMRIGMFGGGGGYPFNGLIDDVRVYNRALSAAEVMSLYQEQVSSSPPMSIGSSTQSNTPAPAVPMPVPTASTAAWPGRRMSASSVGDVGFELTGLGTQRTTFPATAAVTSAVVKVMVP